MQFTHHKGVRDIKVLDLIGVLHFVVVFGGVILCIQVFGPYRPLLFLGYGYLLPLFVFRALLGATRPVLIFKARFFWTSALFLFDFYGTAMHKLVLGLYIYSLDPIVVASRRVKLKLSYLLHSF